MKEKFHKMILYIEEHIGALIFLAVVLRLAIYGLEIIRRIFWRKK